MGAFVSPHTNRRQDAYGGDFERRMRFPVEIVRAIKREAGRQYVVLRRGSEWVQQDVRTGWRSDSTVELLSGVSAGDVVEINSY